MNTNDRKDKFVFIFKSYAEDALMGIYCILCFYTLLRILMCIMHVKNNNDKNKICI